MRGTVALALGVCAFLPTAAAHGSVTIGPHVTPDPATAFTISYPSPSVLFNVDAPPDVQLVAPIAGVITRWSVYVGDMTAGSTIQLRVITADGPSFPSATSFRMVRSGPVETLGGSTG